MSEQSYATAAAPRSITPSITDPRVGRCTDGERLWGFFTAEAIDGKFYAWRVDGSLIGEFPTLGGATEAMIIFGRGS